MTEAQIDRATEAILARMNLVEHTAKQWNLARELAKAALQTLDSDDEWPTEEQLAAHDLAVHQYIYGKR